MADRKTPMPWLKPAVLVGSLVPVASFIWRGARDQLGANPIAEVLNELGLCALIFLVAALLCTPAKVLFGWTWPIRLRRMLGLIAFFYATAHVTTYIGADQVFDFKAIVADILKRPFIFVGFAAWVMLVPLAITSTDKSVRRLGFDKWKLLHRLAYLATGLGVIHFVLRVKKDRTEPFIYGVVVAVALSIRAFDALRARLKKTAAARARSA